MFCFGLSSLFSVYSPIFSGLHFAFLLLSSLLFSCLFSLTFFFSFLLLSFLLCSCLVSCFFSSLFLPSFVYLVLLFFHFSMIFLLQSSLFFSFLSYLVIFVLLCSFCIFFWTCLHYSSSSPILAIVVFPLLTLSSLFISVLFSFFACPRFLLFLVQLFSFYSVLFTLLACARLLFLFLNLPVLPVLLQSSLLFPFRFLSCHLCSSLFMFYFCCVSSLLSFFFFSNRLCSSLTFSCLLLLCFFGLSSLSFASNLPGSFFVIVFSLLLCLLSLFSVSSSIFFALPSSFHFLTCFLLFPSIFVVLLVSLRILSSLCFSVLSFLGGLFSFFWLVLTAISLISCSFVCFLFVFRHLCSSLFFVGLSSLFPFASPTFSVLRFFFSCLVFSVFLCSSQCCLLFWLFFPFVFPSPFFSSLHFSFLSCLHCPFLFFFFFVMPSFPVFFVLLLSFLNLSSLFFPLSFIK